ncbi:CGNR zinc finger domain-containing protein [Pendulispora albinea]|uniref:CGNR zinc finger domain-containing protein n=1 Tax=Pendulispora albinea TaxID=2741071 RepID=A0ABZ2M2F8_9BACT
MAKEMPPAAQRRTKADFRFMGARLCFAFAATLGDRGKAEAFERMVRPADLARWCVESGCIDTPPTCTDDDLVRAKELREAIQRVGEALANRTPTDPRDVAIINRAAAKPPLAPALAPDATAVRWLGDELDAVLSLVARDLITLCASPLRERVHLCENPACVAPFVDASRAGERRWCSMNTCGALSKKRGYRARLRASAD